MSVKIYVKKVINQFFKVSHIQTESALLESKYI